MAKRVRGFRRVLGWAIGLVLFAGIALVLALQLGPVRGWLRDQLLSAVNGSLKGTLSARDIRWPSPQYIELSGVSLRDRHGHEVAAFSTLFARLRLRSLLSGQLELTRVELSDLHVDLADLGNDAGLLSVFESSEPAQKPAADSGMSPLPVTLRRLCVQRGTLQLTLPDGRTLSLARTELCVRLRVHASLQLALESLTGELRLNEAKLATLRAPKDLPALGAASDDSGLALGLAAQLHVHPGADLRFDARLSARGFSPATLRALGVDDATLRGPIDMDAHAVQLEARGPLRYRSEIASAAGGISLSAELDEQRKLHAHLASPALSLSELTSLEVETAGFALEAEAALGDPEHIDAHVELLHGYYGAQALPHVTLAASRDESGRVALTSLRAEEGPASLRGHGAWQPDGALQLNADWSVPELAKLAPVHASDPTLHGRVRGQLALRRGADQQLDARAELELSELGDAAAGVGAARVTTSLAGTLERPRVRLEAHAERLRVPQREVAALDLRLSGGPEHYAFEASADRDWLRVDGWVEHPTREWQLGLTGSLRLPQGPLSVQLPLARVLPGERVELTQLRASFLRAQLMLDGKLDLKGATSQLQLTAAVPDVAQLTEPLGARAVPGRVELAGSLRGELARPRAELTLHAVDGPKWEGHPSAVDVTLHVDAVRGQGDLALLAQAGRAHVRAKLDSRWPRALPLSAALRRAAHELTLELRQLSIPALLDPTNPLPARPVDGTLAADVSVKGSLSKLHITTHVDTQLRGPRDVALTALTADASYENERLELKAAATDARGPLLDLHAATQLALEHELEHPSTGPAWLRAARWQLDAELSERSVYDLPLLRGLGASPELAPLRAKLRASVKHEPHAEPDASLDAEVYWQDLAQTRAAKDGAGSVVGKSPAGGAAVAKSAGGAPVAESEAGGAAAAKPQAGGATAKSQARGAPVAKPQAGGAPGVKPSAAAAFSCTEGVQGFLHIAGKWADQKLGIDMRGDVGPDALRARDAASKGDSLRFAARLPLSFEQLLGGGAPDLSSVQLGAQVQALALQRIPWLCERAQGEVSLAIKAVAPLSKAAQLELRAEGTNLRWQDGAPLGFTLDAHSEGPAVRVAADLQSGPGALHLRGRLPIDVHAAQPAGLVRRSDLLQLDLALQQVPMAALLAFVPDVARVSGAASGEIHAFGSVEQPGVRGKLQLDDVSLTLPRLGQRFSHVDAHAFLEEKSLRLSDVRMRDLGGSVSLAALFTWASRAVWRGEVNVNARNYPVRKTGVVMGRADVDARVVADMKAEQAHVDVALSNVTVQLTHEGMGNVQSLEPHPEFSYADAQPAPAKPAEPESALPIAIHIASSEPLWVRRDDFAVQVQPDLNVELGADKPSLKGKIKLLRGYLSLLGQNFDIKRGEVVLRGGTEVDPQLAITAATTTRDGTVIRVEVTGFVTKPEIAFYKNDNPEAVSAGEALSAMIPSGRSSSSSQSFESEVTSAALGMTTGLLSLTARREFGDWVPMLQIEPGDQTRVRVGVEADRFIPNFLRGFVRGAYVEGIVQSETTTQQGAQTGTATGVAGTTSTAAGSGILIELTLPANLVWAGQYGPGQSWSVDLNWRP